MDLKSQILNKRTILSFIISLGILLYIFSKIDLDKLILILKHTKIFYYFLAIVMFYTAILIRSYRWKIFLKNVNIDLKLKDAFIVYYLSMFVNSLVPAKLGDIYRGYLLKKKTNKSISLGFGTVFIERVFDLVAMISLLFISAYLSFKSDIPKEIIYSIKWGIIIILFLIFLIFGFLVVNSKITLKNKKLEAILINFEKGLKSVKLNTLHLLITLSFIGWFIEGLTIYFIFLALNLNLEILFGVFSDLASSLLTAIPITPSGLGIVEYALMYILKLKNIDENTAFAVLILYRLISYFSVVLFGAIMFYIVEGNILKESK
ncbi:flippase-like domain-containing protein [Methanocaldococcus sp.]|uniref:flippase-like domain-containing protein n=1 Tax=Methanocaldococcus sp. TaxID=2152917 RepID=UPI00262F13D1|nr:flippase-like domain-containing protein [Methanocaldococcus sp.]MCQ6253891.1 flippase-like domain-containing protein [Methanocaldococcus sp.]